MGRTDGTKVRRRFDAQHAWVSAGGEDPSGFGAKVLDRLVLRQRAHDTPTLRMKARWTDRAQSSRRFDGATRKTYFSDTLASFIESTSATLESTKSLR